MSTYTDYLNLFMWNPQTDGEEEFDIEKALNENWKKLDIKVKQHILDTAKTILDFETKVEQDFQTEKQVLETELNTYKQTVDTDMNTYKEEINNNLSSYKEAIDAQIEEFEGNSFATVEMVNDYLGDVYDSSKTYAVGDYCIYENTLYKCTVEITTAEVFDSSKWKKTSVDKEIDNIETAMGGKLSKTGDTMSGDLSLPNSKIKFSNNGGVEWKENGYGDGFRIIPDFNGTDDSNKLKIQGSTGKAGDNLNFNDIASISAKNGNVDFKGSVSAAAGFKGKWNGYTDALPNLGHVANVLDTTITKGFGTYTVNTSNIPSGFDTYGSVLVLPAADSSGNGHNIILFGNNEDTKGKIAIAGYINGNFTGWRSIALNKKYSTSETSTGETWVDGKTIYQKTIKITSLNTGISQQQHGISNFGELIDIYGTGYWSVQGWQPIQRIVTDNIGPYRTWTW